MRVQRRTNCLVGTPCFGACFPFSYYLGEQQNCVRSVLLLGPVVATHRGSKLRPTFSNSRVQMPRLGEDSTSNYYDSIEGAPCHW